jgi:general secretion pathway protein I
VRGRSRQSGFTLVEVLVATAVLAIGLLAVLAAFSMATRVANISSKDTTITFLAQQKLAEIQVEDPSQLVAGVTQGTFAPAHPDYSWDMTIYRPDDLNIVRIDLTVYDPQSSATRFTTAVF